MPLPHFPVTELSLQIVADAGKGWYGTCMDCAIQMAVGQEHPRDTESYFPGSLLGMTGPSRADGKLTSKCAHGWSGKNLESKSLRKPSVTYPKHVILLEKVPGSAGSVGVHHLNLLHKRLVLLQKHTAVSLQFFQAERLAPGNLLKCFSRKG